MPGAVQGTTPTINTAGGAPEAAPAAGGPLSFLRENPQFQQMRAAVQAQPDLLPQLLQALGSQSPQLLALIQQNRDEFLGLLQEGGGGAPGAGGGQQQQYVQVTPAQNDAIQRLMTLGNFTQMQAYEAFMVCGENEEAAANFLFDSAFE